MKRYILFAYDRYYPGGGACDEIGRYDTLEEIQEKMSATLYDWYDVLDLYIGEWVEFDDWLGWRE